MSNMIVVTSSSITSSSSSSSSSRSSSSSSRSSSMTISIIYNISHNILYYDMIQNDIMLQLRGAEAFSRQRAERSRSRVRDEGRAAAR